MFCRNCSNEVNENAVACPSCGVAPSKETKFCHGCGAETNANQLICVKCGISLASLAAQKTGGKSKVTAGILGILIGSLGIHKFYLGYSGAGIITLLLSLVLGIFTAGIVTGIMGTIGLIEGIIYLTKSDDEFYMTYVNGKKSWF